VFDTVWQLFNILLLTRFRTCVWYALTETVDCSRRVWRYQRVFTFFVYLRQVCRGRRGSDRMVVELTDTNVVRLSPIRGEMYSIQHYVHPQYVVCVCVCVLSSSCVFCTRCCQCLWIVPSWLSLLDCTFLIVPSWLYLLDCPFLIVPSWLSLLDCTFLIVPSWLYLRFLLMFI
jgi:hypothetical protein